MNWINEKRICCGYANPNICCSPERLNKIALIIALVMVAIALNTSLHFTLKYPDFSAFDFSKLTCTELSVIFGPHVLGITALIIMAIWPLKGETIPVK